MPLYFAISFLFISSKYLNYCGLYGFVKVPNRIKNHFNVLKELLKYLTTSY